jgi:hypothetical protein
VAPPRPHFCSLLSSDFQGWVSCHPWGEFTAKIFLCPQWTGLWFTSYRSCWTAGLEDHIPLTPNQQAVVNEREAPALACPRLATFKESRVHHFFLYCRIQCMDLFTPNIPFITWGFSVCLPFFFFLEGVLKQSLAM